jgi:hypothetical protein
MTTYCLVYTFLIHSRTHNHVHLTECIAPGVESFNAVSIPSKAADMYVGNLLQAKHYSMLCPMQHSVRTKIIGSGKMAYFILNFSYS